MLQGLAQERLPECHIWRRRPIEVFDLLNTLATALALKTITRAVTKNGPGIAIAVQVCAVLGRRPRTGGQGKGFTPLHWAVSLKRPGQRATSRQHLLLLPAESLPAQCRGNHLRRLLRHDVVRVPRRVPALVNGRREV